MLVVLDTWGGSVPIGLIRRIATNVSSEVIVTIQPQYFTRFAGSSDVAHGDRVFGGVGWRRVTEQRSSQKARWLLQHYRDTVKSVGFPHVLDFELIDNRGQALYLVFGTTHPRGLQKMKEAMWEVDDVNGVGYRDPRDPGQQTLDIQVEPQTAPLRRLIVDYLSSEPNRQAAFMSYANSRFSPRFTRRVKYCLLCALSPRRANSLAGGQPVRFLSATS